jgi:hypothetical protein
MTEVAESLIAQLHSHQRLTTPRCENLKIQHKIEILKANEHAPHVYKLQIYQMTSKKHTTKSRETILLTLSFTTAGRLTQHFLTLSPMVV